MPADDHFFAHLMHCFVQIDKWIPGSSTKVGELLMGKLPEADPAEAYQLADSWGAVSERLNTFYMDIEHAADHLMTSWVGDGGAMAFQDAWTDYVSNISSVVEGASQLQQSVQGYGLEMETEEFLIAVNLIQLLVAMISALITAIFGGISLLALAGDFAMTRTGIWMAFKKCIEEIIKLGKDAILKEWTKLTEKGIGRGLLRVGGDIAKEFGPRRILARSAGERAAREWGEDTIRNGLLHDLMNAFARGTERKFSQRLADRYLAKKAAGAVTGRIAKGVEEGILKRAVEDGAGRTVARDAVDDFVAKKVAETALWKEAGKFVGERAWAGAKFMGVREIGGQAYELLTGERTSFDVQEAATSLGQGALMGGLMFGHGFTGQVLTGGLAGAGVAGAMDVYQKAMLDYQIQHTTDPAALADLQAAYGKIDVGKDMLSGAGSGALMGGMFHGLGSTVGLGSKLAPDLELVASRIGADRVEGLPGDAAGIWNAPGLGESGAYSPAAFGQSGLDNGLAWSTADGTVVHQGPQGDLVTVGAPELSGGGPHTNVVEAPPATAPTTVEARTTAPTTVSEGGTRAPATEAGTRATGGGDGPRATAKAAPTHQVPVPAGGDGGGGGGGHPTTPVSERPEITPTETSTGTHTSPPASEHHEDTPAPTVAGHQPTPATHQPVPPEVSSTVDTGGPPTPTTSAPVAHETTGTTGHDGSTASPGPGGDPPGGPPPSVETPRTPIRMVEVPSTPLTGETARLPEQVSHELDAQIAGLRDIDPNTFGGAHDMPDSATWDARTGLMTVHYPDGTTAHVAFQINEALPGGRPVVVLPSEHGHAVIALPSHVPADPALLHDTVAAQFHAGLSTVYSEFRGSEPASRLVETRPTETRGPEQRTDEPRDDDPGGDDPPGDEPLGGSEQPTEPVVEEPVDHTPTVQAGEITVREPARTGSPPAHEPTQASVRTVLGDTKAPETLRQEVGTHLTELDLKGQVHPRSDAAIAHTTEALRTEAREATAQSPAVEEHSGEQWASAARGVDPRIHADGMTHGERLLRDLLDRTVPGGIHGADRATLAEAATRLADRLAESSPETLGHIAPAKLLHDVFAEKDAAGEHVRWLSHDEIAQKIDNLAGTHEPTTHEVGTHQPGTHQPGTHQVGTHGAGTHEATSHPTPGPETGPLPGHDLAPESYHPVATGTPTEHSDGFNRQYAEWRTETLPDGTTRQYVVTVTERVERTWTTLEFQDVPVHEFEGGARGAEAAQVVHEAAHELAAQEHARNLDGLERWLSHDGMRIEDADLGQSGGMAAAVLLPDGKLVAATSYRESTAPIRAQRYEPEMSRRWHQKEPDAQRRDIDRLNQRAINEIGTRKSSKMVDEPAHHWAVQRALDAPPKSERSDFHGKCAEPKVLDEVVSRLERDFQQSWTDPEGGPAEAGNPRYEHDFLDHVRQHLDGGQIASHRVTGQDLVHSEELPCATDDYLIHSFGLSNDYVDHVIAQAHVDTTRGVVILAGEGDPLRTNGLNLEGFGDGHLVVVLHSDLVDGRIQAEMGGRTFSTVEVSRVLTRLVAEHPELGNRKVVLLTCEGSTSGGGRQNASTFARDVAVRTGLEVAGATGKVWISDQGRIVVSHLDPGSAAGDARVADPIGQGQSQWREYTPGSGVGDEGAPAPRIDELIHQAGAHAPPEVPTHEAGTGHQPANQEHWAKAASHDEVDTSTHDELWSDPPWHHEGRPPSFDELIPTSDAEVARWEGAIKQELASQFHGREFAGVRIKLDPADHDSISVYKNSVTVRLDLQHPETGTSSHHSVMYTFARDHDGTLYAEHVSVRIPDSLQGTGFSAGFNNHMVDAYRASGVERIEIHAASTVGGYAWARAHFDWAPGSEYRATAVFDRLRGQVRELNQELARLDRYEGGDRTENLDSIRERYGVSRDPAQLRQEMIRQRAEARDILDRAAKNPFGSARYPTPHDVAMAGFNGAHGKDAMWIGKRTMLGANWMGVKPISDGVVRFPRDAHVAAPEQPGIEAAGPHPAQAATHPSSGPVPSTVEHPAIGPEPVRSTVEHSYPLVEHERGAQIADEDRTLADNRRQSAVQDRATALHDRQQAATHRAEAQRAELTREAHQRVAAEHTYRRDDALQEAGWHDQNAVQHERYAQAYTHQDPARAAEHQRTAQHERSQAEQARDRAYTHESELRRADEAYRSAEQTRQQHAEQAQRLDRLAAQAEEQALARERQAELHEDAYVGHTRELEDQYRTHQQSAADEAGRHYREAGRRQDEAAGHEEAAQRNWQAAENQRTVAERYETQAWEQHRLAAAAEDQARLLTDRADVDGARAEALRTAADPAYHQVAEHLDRVAQQARTTAAEQRALAEDHARQRDAALTAAASARQGEEVARRAAGLDRDAARSAREARDNWHDTGTRWHEHFRDTRPGGDMVTGGSIRPVDDLRAWEWADHAYGLFRADGGDVADIAAHLAAVERPSGAVGFSPAEIAQVKSHLMFEAHLIDDFEGGLERRTFDADPDIAEAWIRLREGRHLPEDLVLVEHELRESQYLRQHPGATYRDAHEFASREYDWAGLQPARTGEDLSTSWGERQHGDTGGLPEGSRGPTGGRVHLRVSGAEPSPGDHQGFGRGSTVGGRSGQELFGRARDDRAGLPEPGHLAESGNIRGLGTDGLDPIARALAGTGAHEPTISTAVISAADHAGVRVLGDRGPEDRAGHLRDGYDEGRPGQPAPSQSTLRYAVELPGRDYAEHAQRLLDDLAARGYEPVRLTGSGDGALLSRWRDPASGQEFTVRLDTPESRAAHAAVREWQQARRDGAEPAREHDLTQRYRTALDHARPPEGADRVHLPEHPGPHAWSGAPEPLVHGPAAVQAVADFAHQVRAGLDFSGDPRMQRHAAALAAEPGVVKLALHGRANGEVVVGRVRMSAADFARGLAELRRSGQLDLTGRTVKLITCYAGRGGDQSIAAHVARELGVEVTGATGKVWTYLDGRELVVSPNVHNGRSPHLPPDGEWRAFGPDGREIGPAPAVAPAAHSGQSTVAGHAGAVGSRAGPVLHRGGDGELHAPGDPLGSRRTPDGALHFPGDRAHTYRDPDGSRLHHVRDAPRTYRTERDFRLVDEATHRVVPDPLADRTHPAQHAVEGTRQPYAPTRPAPELDAARRHLDGQRQALADFRRDTLRPVMDDLAVTDPHALTRAELPRTLDDLRLRHAGDPVAEQRIKDLERAIREQGKLAAEVRRAVAELPRAAARHVLADRYGIAGDEVVAGGTPGSRRQPGDFAVAGFDRVGHRLVVLETTPTKDTGHVLQDGTRTERGTAAYLRDVLETSPRLHEYLGRHPELLDELHRALARGDLTIEYHRVETEVDGSGRISVWTHELDTQGLDLSGVAGHLPPASGAGDPRLGERLHESAQRLENVLSAGPAGRPGPHRVTVLDEHTVEVQPARGPSYQLRIDSGGDRDFAVTLHPDGVHRVEFSPEAADRLDADGLDRLMARAIGHVDGEVAATSGGRLGRFLGLHGGRLGGHDALVNDPVPGRDRLSYRDVSRLGEFEALARLHAATTDAARTGVEADLRRFIENNSLREGVPGADRRVELAGGRLSEDARALLAEQRAWWRDSDPAVAGTRLVLHESGLLVGGKVVPVDVRGHTYYRVEPDGWTGGSKATFTFEVRSGHPANGQLAEFHGTRQARHYTLVVDRDAVDLQGAGRFRVGTQLKGVLAEQINRQSVRAPERRQSPLERVLNNLPNLTQAGATLEVARLLHAEILTTKGVAVNAFDLATNDTVMRRITMDAVERRHDRQLSALADRVEPGELQPRVDATFGKAADLAEALLGDRSVVNRTVHPLPDAPPDRRPVPEHEAAPLRGQARQVITEVNRGLRHAPIEHLRKVRMLSGDRYRVVVRDGANALVHVAAARTGSGRIEVSYRPDRIVMKVPPELAHATDAQFRATVRDALSEVAARQYGLHRDEIALGDRLAEGAATEVPLESGLYFSGEALVNQLGEVIIPGTIAHGVVQVVADRVLGPRALDAADQRARFDAEASSQLTGDQVRNLANQVAELSGGGERVALRLLDDLLGGQHGTGAPAAAPPSHAAAVEAVRRAMVEVNARHGGTFSQVKEVYAPGHQLSRVSYGTEGMRWRNRAELRITFGHVPDGRAVVPAGRRVSGGRFELIVNEDADPGLIRRTLAHIGDNVLVDREQKIPLRRRVYEDFLPAASQLGGAAAVGAVSHSVGAFALAGVGAGMHLVGRWVDGVHQVRQHDIDLNRTLLGGHTEDVTPAELRDRLGHQQDAVEQLERQAREIEARLAADPRTAAAVDAIRHEYGALPTPAHDLLPDLDNRVADLTGLPRDARIATVTDAGHTFRVSFTGPHRRPEQLTFEVEAGQAGGPAVVAHRVESDVLHALRVDPTRSPDEIAQGIHDWLAGEIDRVAAGPTGLPGAHSRLLTFARQTGAETVASAASVVVGQVHTPHGDLGTNALVQGTWAGNAAVGAGSRQLAAVSTDGNRAVSDLTRAEVTARNFGTANDQHLSLFAGDADHLVNRTWLAYDRLQYLEHVAGQLPVAERPDLFQHGPITRANEPVVWGDEAGPHPRAAEIAALRRLEQELGRDLFHDPVARGAADRALSRLVDVLAALNPEQPRSAVEAALFGDDYRNAGTLSAGVTSLASVHEQGNLRMIMTAYYNGVLQSHHPLDLNHSLRRVLLEDGWQERVAAAGLDVDALTPVRERLLADPDHNLMDTRVLAGEHGHARLLVAEHRASQAARVARDPQEQLAYRKTPRDLAESGIPLHPDEYEALRRHDELTLTVDGEPRVVNPRDYDLRPGEEGPELPVGWVDGSAWFSVDPEHPWHQEIVDGHGLPVAAGVSGTAARLIAAFGWMRVPEVAPEHFLHATMGWMLSAGDHSLYELARGAQLADPNLFGEHARGFTSIGDLLHRLPGLSPDRVADIVWRADDLVPTVPAEMPGVAAHLAAASLVRDGFGGLDDNGVRRLLDRLPEVPGMSGQPSTYTLGQLLHHGGPEGSPGAQQRAALLRYTADALGRSAGELALERVGGDGGAKGASGAPVFWVRDGAGARIAVVKVFPKPEEFARELSVLQRLHAEGFDRLAVPEVRGLGVARAHDASAGVLISAVAAGRPLDDLMVAVADAPPEHRPAAVAALSRAFRDTGAALAEMHERPLGAGGEVADWFPDRYGTVRAAESLREWAGHEPFQRMYGFDGDAVARRYAELGEATRQAPGLGALVHGDPHPGNFFHDPVTGRVTVIDLEGMHSSMDAHGRPVGIAALDVGIFEQVASAFVHNFEIADLLPELQRHFFEGYTQAAGHPLPEAALRYYRASGLGLALHGTRRMLFGEVPRDPSITQDNLDLRARRQLAAIHDILGLSGRPEHVAPEHVAPEHVAPDHGLPPETPTHTQPHPPADAQGQTHPTPPVGPVSPPDAVVNHPDLPVDPKSKPVHYGTPLTRAGAVPPLFDGPPVREQVAQGGLGDCGVVAGIGAVAGHRPDVVANAIRVRPDGSYEVTLHEVSRADIWTLRPTGRVLHLVVSPEVPVRDDEPTRSAYMNQTDIGTAWASVLEKATAGVDSAWGPDRAAHHAKVSRTGNHGYARLGDGTFTGDQAEVLAQLTGEPARVVRFDKDPGHEAQVTQELSDALAAHKPVLISIAAPPAGQSLPHKLIGDHAYEVVRVENGVVHLRNPWNVRHPEPMTVAELLKVVKPLYATLE